MRVLTLLAVVVERHLRDRVVHRAGRHHGSEDQHRRAFLDSTDAVAGLRVVDEADLFAEGAAAVVVVRRRHRVEAWA